MIKLNRNHIFVIVLLLLVTIQFTNPLLKYFTQKTTPGIIVDMQIVEGGTYNTKFTQHTKKYYVPVAEYTVSQTKYLLKGPGYSDKKMTEWYRDTVTIIYDPAVPSDASFLTVTAFWFPQYMQKLVILMVLCIAIYSFFHRTQFLVIRYHRINDEPILELTKTVKDQNLKTRLKRARESMYRNPRR